LAVAEPPTKHVFSLCGATMVPSWLRFPGTIVHPPPSTTVMASYPSLDRW